MALTDEVAARVMGEMHTITKRIDAQHRQVVDAASEMKIAAKLISENTDLAVKNAKEAALQAQLETSRRFELGMADAALKTLSRVAGSVATKSATQWVVVGVAFAGVLAVAAGWIGYTQGKDAGEAFGYAQAREESAAAAWGATPEGKLAYGLAKEGSIQKLALCQGIGWSTKDGVCFVDKTEDGKIYGWRISKK